MFFCADVKAQMSGFAFIFARCALCINVARLNPAQELFASACRQVPYNNNPLPAFLGFSPLPLTPPSQRPSNRPGGENAHKVRHALSG